MKGKKLDITKMINNNIKETKEVASIRIKPSDKELILDAFGSIQKAVDALIKELKG